MLGDVSEGKNFMESLREHASKGLVNLGDRIQQCGKGGGGGTGRQRRSRMKQPNQKNNTSTKIRRSRRTIRAFPQLPLEETLPVGNGENSIVKRSAKRRRRPDQLDYI